MAPYVDAAYGDVAGSAGLHLRRLRRCSSRCKSTPDFAGYSHIAIGCARLLGFDLMRNFAYPYFSRSPAELWHRWHISLSTWFRDYVYIPLGGSRARHVRNLLITFGLSGLWHGAGLNFVAWGLFHGALVAIQWWPANTRLDAPAGEGALPDLRSALAIAVSPSAWSASAGCSFAPRACTTRGGSLRRCSAGRPWLPSRRPGALLGAVVATVSLLEWAQRCQPHPLANLRGPTLGRWAIYLALAMAVILLGSTQDVPFVYFQF